MARPPGQNQECGGGWWWKQKVHISQVPSDQSGVEAAAHPGTELLQEASAVEGPRCRVGQNQQSLGATWDTVPEESELQVKELSTQWF